MGKLIDADELLTHIEDFGEGQYRLNLIDPYYVRNAPTVEAIPKTEMKKMLRDCADKVSDNILDIVRKEYIPKDQYENRLKADMAAMLEDLDLQIDESAAYNLEVAKVQRLIREKINELKGESDEHKY